MERMNPEKAGKGMTKGVGSLLMITLMICSLSFPLTNASPYGVEYSRDSQEIKRVPIELQNSEGAKNDLRSLTVEDLAMELDIDREVLENDIEEFGGSDRAYVFVIYGKGQEVKLYLLGKRVISIPGDSQEVTSSINYRGRLIGEETFVLRGNELNSPFEVVSGRPIVSALESEIVVGKASLDLKENTLTVDVVPEVQTYKISKLERRPLRKSPDASEVLVESIEGREVDSSTALREINPQGESDSRMAEEDNFNIGKILRKFFFWTEKENPEREDSIAINLRNLGR